MTVMENVEDRIRRRAYEIWEQEGRPHGREVDHWLQAAREIAATEGHGGGGQAAEPTAGPPKPAARTRKAGVKEPSAQLAPPAAAARARRSTDGQGEAGAESAPLSSAPRRAPKPKGETSATASRIRRRREEA